MPILDLLDAPYSLPWGSSIYATIASLNSKGLSDYSDAGNGAIILTIPDSPSNISYDPDTSSAIEITLIWD